MATELRALELAVRRVTAAGVEFSASRAELMAANIWLRVASRVIVRLDDFEARDFATLEKRASRVPWHRVLTGNSQVSLRVSCRKSRLYHSDAVAERVARAITRAIGASVVSRQSGVEDAIGAAAGAGSGEQGDADYEDGRDEDRRSLNGGAAHVQSVIVRLERDHVTVSADSSGELLHRRGWRQAVAKAPLRETLAAAMVMAADWGAGVDEALVDPFCGSGTIGIEAALRTRNIAPGLMRNFAMETWPGTDASVLDGVRALARAAGKRSTGGRTIVMSDRDAGAVTAARANAERAGVAADVVIEQRAISDNDLARVSARGLVLTNPPYGLRASEGADLRGLYARLGDVLRAGGADWRLAMLVADKRVAGQTRIPLESRFQTNNGGIAVSLETSR